MPVSTAGIRLPDAAGFAAIAGRLRDRYQVEEPKPSMQLLDELVATILSQHTSDLNSHRAFRELKGKYPRWSEVLTAGPAAVAAAIRTGGLAEQKAPRIIALLQSVPRDEQGEPSLDGSLGLPPDEVYARLQRFAGVGPKTAACALLFAFGWPFFPVDTHVQRVSTRLGWAAPGESAERIQARLMKHVPAAATYDLHMGMVRHGRMTCAPRSPRCAECVIADRCQSAGSIAAANEVRPQVSEGS